MYEKLLLICAALYASTAAADNIVCNGVPEWQSTATYSASGTLVQYEGDAFENKYYTQGNVPNKDDTSGPWQYEGVCENIPTKMDTVSININTFPKKGLVFTDTSGKTYDLKTDGTTIQLPYSVPTTYTISSYNGTVTPNSFVANSDGQTLNITYKPFPPLTGPVLAGYLTASWGEPLTISNAAQMGYDIVIVAFSEISGNSIGLVQDQFIAYTHWNTMTSEIQKTIRQDIQYAKANDGLGKVLLSIGGANGGITFPVSSADQKTLASNTITLLNTYGFDGIDIDMENAAPDGGVAMDQFLQILKIMTLANGEHPIISAAPQLNSIASDSNDNTEVSIVSTAKNGDYNQAIVHGDFNYLFIQAYNTGSKTNVINGTNETDPQYIANSYYYLAAGYPGILPGSTSSETISIPASTKIVIGEPATQSAAGAATIFHNQDVSDPYQSMVLQYQQLMGNSQYGGAMTWDIGHDQEAGCPFTKAISVYTSKTFKFCPKNI